MKQIKIFFWKSESLILKFKLFWSKNQHCQFKSKIAAQNCFSFFDCKCIFVLNCGQMNKNCQSKLKYGT